MSFDDKSASNFVTTKMLGISHISKRILIGIVVPSLESSGGVQSIVEMLIKQIERSELYDYLLVSLATSTRDDCSSSIRYPLSLLNGPKVKSLVWRERKMIHIGCSMVEFEFMRYWKRDVLKSTLSQCDLIQVVGGFPAWGVSVLDCLKPVAVWAATRSVWERETLLNANKGVVTIWRRLMTVLINRMDDRAIRESGVIMVMNHMMSEYAAGLRKGNEGAVVNVTPSVDTSWFYPGNEEFANRFDTEDPYILTVGRFDDPRKNPELLLEAYKLLTEKVANCPKLTLAGATSPPDIFWEKVINLGLNGRVTFCEKPDSEQLRNLYQGALCFALSSNEEGFGMVIVEAMACGIPAVATRCGGPNDIISNSEDGYLVEIGNAAALADKLYLLCSDLSLNSQMGMKARKTVMSRFSEQYTHSIFFDTWKKLLAV